MKDLVDEHIELWSRELPDLDPRVEGIVTRIQVLERHRRHQLEQALAAQGLKMWEFKTLHILRRGGAPYRATATELAAALDLSPDGRELVSAGHDASLRFWSLEKRSCIQEITSHRLMRGEGVCSVCWSRDGRWVVSAGGDGVVKVFAR